MKTYRLGILGLGEGRALLSAADTSSHWQTRAICDLDEALLGGCRREFGVSHATPDYGEMLADPSLDAVAVFTPEHLHAEHIIRALEAGKHVICTKPLLADLSESKPVLEAAERSGRHVFVGQSTRFFEPMQRQREDFEAGRNGGVITVEAHYCDDKRGSLLRRDWYGSDDFRWLFSGLSHPVDLVRWYLPEIVEVFAYGAIAPGEDGRRYKNHDTIHAVFRGADGRVARATGCYGGPEANRQGQDVITCTVRGTSGTTQANYYGLNYYTHFDGEPPCSYNFDHLAAHYFRFTGFHNHAGEFQNYLDYMARCLDSGDAPKPDLREGLETLAVLDAIAESLETGYPVRVADILRRQGLESMIARDEQHAESAVPA